MIVKVRLIRVERRTSLTSMTIFAVILQSSYQLTGAREMNHLVR